MALQINAAACLVCVVTEPRSTSSGVKNTYLAPPHVAGQAVGNVAGLDATAPLGVCGFEGGWAARCFAPVAPESHHLGGGGGRS